MLLAILLLQAGGMLFVYKMQQCAVQLEMQQTLNDSKTYFEKMTLSVGDYKKNKINSREICIKGKMYDVKAVNISGNNVELLVINDSKEEYILCKIKDFINRVNEPTSNIPFQLQQLLSLYYLSANIDNLFLIRSLSIHIFCPLNLNLVSNFSDISTPPPQLV